MEDLLQSYGNWILYGVVSLGCILMHVLGIGHGGHGHSNESRSVEGTLAARDKQGE